MGRHDLDIDWHKDQASGQTQKLSPPTDRDPPIKTSLSRDVDPPKSHRPDSPSYQPTLPVYVSSDEYETESEEEEETKHEIPPSKRDKNRHHKTQSAMLKALKTQISLIEQSIKAEKRQGNSSSNPQANQLVMTKTKPVPISSAKPLNVSERGLAHLKVGLHASLPAEPTWHYALLDSGCTDNLISIKTIQALPDYEKITITGTESKNLRTANNDMSQQIHGKTTLNVSLISEDNERIVLSMPFYVVDGLIYDIFIGQPFLSSEDKISEDNDHIYVKNSTPNESSNDTKNDKKIHKIKKTYKKHKTTKTIQKHNIPANSSVRVQTNQLYPEANPDMFTYFTPSDAFHLNHPSLHIMNQTVLSPQNNRSVEIFIVNTEDREVLLPAHTKIGHIHTEFIDQAEISPLNAFDLSKNKRKSSPEMKHENNLFETVNEIHNVVINHDRFCSNVDIIDHELTESEKIERSKQYSTEGFFQKSVSEVVQSDKITSMDYEGEEQFVPKTDDELIASCNLDHFNDEEKEEVIAMLRRNIGAFQRHPLDIGEFDGLTAYIPLKVKDPPILCAKYVPIPLKYKKHAQKLIDEYVRAGVLTDTTDACQFTSNIFVIPKPNGKFRMIFDGRLASKYTEQLPLALGNFDEIFSSLAGMTRVSKLDASHAYDHIRVDEKTSKMLSFFGPNNKRYRYLRCGQGLKFSSYFLQQAMNMILYGLPYATSYCDDVFVASSGTLTDHLEKLETVIKRFEKHNMRLNLAKLEISPPTLDFLGLTWS